MPTAEETSKVIANWLSAAAKEGSPKRLAVLRTTAKDAVVLVRDMYGEPDDKNSLCAVTIMSEFAANLDEVIRIMKEGEDE